MGELLLLPARWRYATPGSIDVLAVRAAAPEGPAAGEDRAPGRERLDRRPRTGRVRAADVEIRNAVVEQGAELSIAVQALQPRLTTVRRMPWRLLALLLIGQLLASMDASILTVATPVLQHELDASPTMLQAIFAAYTFTFGVLVVTGARLGDDRGHGNMFLAGLAGFTATSLLCGLAPSRAVLLVGRLVQGACGALMTPQTLQVIQRRFERRRTERAVGLYAMVLALGVCAGRWSAA
jgi:hypothetical protein